ncbi:norbelladine synthase-like [Lolium rigidum]|uniref:norbelladine synthase-like n=1 Tax=Lolium rigidum TaxID=89674 RepID=UPI001F5DB2C2|nr:norbelladine synthase-like [Lolium rigidum]
MKGSLCHELETGLPAADVWEVYGSLLLPELIPQVLPTIVAKVEVSGDGGVGTILHVTFCPGLPLKYQKEKFIKVDHENLVKEAIVVEGTVLDLGFLKYLMRFEIVGSAAKNCVIRSTLEYEVADGDTNTASLASTDTLASLAEAITRHLKEQKSANQAS